MLEVLLRGEGHEARIAFDGPEAIEAVQLYKPDVVLLDLMLHSMSGVDVATELRRISELSACLLVAVSGHGEESLPSPSPFDHHFQKPVDLAALLGYLSRSKPGQSRRPARRRPSPEPEQGGHWRNRRTLPPRRPLGNLDASGSLKTADAGTRSRSPVPWPARTADAPPELGPRPRAKAARAAAPDRRALEDSGMPAAVGAGVSATALVAFRPVGRRPLRLGPPLGLPVADGQKNNAKGLAQNKCLNFEVSGRWCNSTPRGMRPSGD